MRGAALWYAPREAAGPYRCCCGAGWGPAPTPIRLGPFGFPLTLLSPRLACTSPLWAIAASLTPLGSPVLDLSMTRSSPSFRPAGAGQTGWWQASRARQTEPSLQPRCQLGPSGCLMHDSVATASALRGRKTGPAGPAPAGDGRAGSRKSGVPVVLHRSAYGPPSRPPMDWLLRSSRDQRMGTDRQVNQPTGQS